MEEMDEVQAATDVNITEISRVFNDANLNHSDDKQHRESLSFPSNQFGASNIETFVSSLNQHGFNNNKITININNPIYEYKIIK